MSKLLLAPLFALIFTVPAHAGRYGPALDFPPNSVDAITAIVVQYVDGVEPAYRPSSGEFDDVRLYGSAAGLVAGLRLNPRRLTPDVRRATVRAVGELALLALHVRVIDPQRVGPIEGEGESYVHGSVQITFRRVPTWETVVEQLNHLIVDRQRMDVDVNAVRFLREVARGRRVRVARDEATVALDAVTKRTLEILDRRGRYKDASIDSRLVEELFDVLLAVDESRGLRYLGKFAIDHGFIGQVAKEMIVDRAVERYPGKHWRSCYRLLSPKRRSAGTTVAKVSPRTPGRR